MEQGAATSLIRFSLDDVPEPARRETLTEVFGRGVVNMEFRALSERPQFAFEIRLLPGAALTWGWGTPHISSTGHDRSLENDDLMLVWASRPGRGQMLHRGKEVFGDGTGAFVSCAEPMVGATNSEFHFVNVRMSRSALRPLLASPDDFLMRPVAPSNGALRLLKSYLRIVRESALPDSPELAHAVSLHVADLMALAVGATRDGREIAAERGGRAARLASIKTWALERLHDPAMSVTAVAAAHGISPRYVQLMFEQDGTSFTAWLRERRLALAARRLADPAFAHRTITSIAFDCGFSDLSWFNHAFRRAFGVTPSDVRNGGASTTSPISH